MKKSSLVLLGCLSVALPVSAVNILSPTDFIQGGVSDGTQFQVGVVGTAAGVNNWPAGEPPADIVNGIIGGGAEKYLNFAEVNTGVVITPVFGSSVISSMELWVANDAVERDPASYELRGTNVAIGGGPYNLSDFALISSGALALPDPRDTVADALGNSQVVAFANSNAYTSYMLLFPTVKSDTANSMQISEVQFDGVVPEPASVLFLIGAAGIGLARRKR